MILGCVPSYTSYQDSSSALIVGSPLLSYLDIRLQGFLPKGLTTSEARHLGPRLVRQDSLEPIRDGSRDNVFQGRAVYIPVEAPILEDPVAEGPIAEDQVIEDPVVEDPVIEEPIPTNLTVGRGGAKGGALAPPDSS